MYEGAKIWSSISNGIKAIEYITEFKTLLKKWNGTPCICKNCMICTISDYLTTCDNQFGFKASHGTDMCIYTLKEFIDYYKCRGTTVYVTFLDASKAFDRLNYWLLFDKLIKKRFSGIHTRRCVFDGAIQLLQIFL